MLAYRISPSAAAAESATPASSRLAGMAGTALITASASAVSGACAEPTVSRQPAWVRTSSRTIALVRMTAPDAAASASGRVPSPPVSVVNTGRCRLGERAVAAGRLRERRQRRGERQVFAPARVHAAEQRLHQPVYKLRAEPAADHTRHGHVRDRLPGRQARLLRCPGEPCLGQDPGSGELADVSGNPHELAP